MDQIIVVIPSRKHTPHLPRTLEMTECGLPLIPPVNVVVGVTRKPVCEMCVEIRARRWLNGLKK